VDLAELHSITRGSPRAAFARQVAMYLAHISLGASLTEIGSLFERDRTTVAHACALVEDRRDDPELDSKLDYLEQAVSAMLNAVSLPGGLR
jgi:chromosomal replication initiation ATPase DnaA